MSTLVDLRSDTVTKPTPQMLAFMSRARVGDDVLGDDPTVKELEELAASMLGYEAALFCPSGTMCNQLAIKLHTQPGTQVLCEATSHIWAMERLSCTAISGVSLLTVQGTRGRLTPQQVEQALASCRPDQPVSLLCIENTTNLGGGAVYTIEEMRAIRATARKHKIKLHLDGARIFNALVRLGEKAERLSGIADSMMFCLSKGLGCPVGSVLLGNKEFISEARRWRRLLGGGMRQAGYLAAAGIYALKNHIERLQEDHERAQKIAKALASSPLIEEITPPETNIIVCKTKGKAKEFVRCLQEEGVLCLAISENTVRMVTHLDIDEKAIAHFQKALSKAEKKLMKR